MLSKVSNTGACMILQTRHQGGSRSGTRRTLLGLVTARLTKPSTKHVDEADQKLSQGVVLAHASCVVPHLRGSRSPEG